MTTRAFLLILVIAAFGVLTARALMETGYFGLISMHLNNWGNLQLLTDLVIVCLLACIWMFQDSGKSGVSAWPFIAITLAAGSFGPLLYLLVRELRSGQKSAVLQEGRSQGAKV